MAQTRPGKDAQFNPAAQSLDYQARKEDWDLVTALLGGTRAMREAAETYLPQHGEEEDADYEVRLNSSVLYNAFEGPQSAGDGVDHAEADPADQAAGQRRARA